MAKRQTTDQRVYGKACRDADKRRRAEYLAVPDGATAALNKPDTRDVWTRVADDYQKLDHDKLFPKAV